MSATAEKLTITYPTYADALARKQQLEDEGKQAWADNVAQEDWLDHHAFHRLPQQQERRLVYKAVCQEVWRLSRIENPERWQ